MAKRSSIGTGDGQFDRRLAVDDWKFEVLLKWINSFMLIGRGFYRKILVHPILNLQNKAQQYLQQYLEKFNKPKVTDYLGEVSIYFGHVRDFTSELRNRWEKFNSDNPKLGNYCKTLWILIL
jgi:hypothetical protein